MNRDELMARKREIEVLGNQYAMAGLAPPDELEEEYRVIVAALTVDAEEARS